MKKDNVYILEDRGLLYLNGEDAKVFLQNLYLIYLELLNIIELLMHKILRRNAIEE